MKPIIRFGRDFERDARNWWEANNQLSYGYDFGKRCPPKIRKEIKGKKWPEVKNYIKKIIKGKYKEYSKWKINYEEYIKPYEEQIIKRLEKIHNRKLPVERIYIYYTSFPRSPYGGGKKIFWIQEYRYKKNKKNILLTLTHELMHLFFHKYYWNTCKKQGLTNNQTHDIKEAFSVLINEEFKDIKLKDRGYDSHRKLRNYILKEWKKNKNFEKVLQLTIKYYKKNETKKNKT